MCVCMCVHVCVCTEIKQTGILVQVYQIIRKVADSGTRQLIAGWATLSTNMRFVLHIVYETSSP